MKNILLLSISVITLSACGITSSISSPKGEGQVIFHWEKENTGIKKFSRDHNECMKQAEAFRFIPNFKTWFYSEEARNEIRPNWHAEKGVWASYVAYPGAQPVVLNSLWRNEDINPRKYRLCMESRGYWHRTYDIPTVTNVFVYKPQFVPKDLPLDGYGL
ncbi:MAG: hypothetical protein LBR70_05675 [Lactobacillaceae bacterium]|jgi:hypothetical protein|nr:hypothetical protein [Lactobacillaceae bacterium]